MQTDHNREPVKILTYDGHTFLLSAKVAEPDVASIWVAKHMHVMPTDVVADIGTGSGFLAVLAARICNKVVAIDANAHAVECARTNVSINGYARKVEIRAGEFPETLADDQFTLFVANLPQMPTPPQRHRADWVGLADSGGESGRRLIDKAVAEVPKYLLPGGKFIFSQYSFLNIDTTVSQMQDIGYEAIEVREIEIPVGRLTWERLDYIEALGYDTGVTLKRDRAWHKLAVISGTWLRVGNNSRSEGLSYMSTGDSTYSLGPE